MEFDIEVVHRPSANHQATGEICCIPEAFLCEGGGGEAQVDDDILISFIP